MEKVDINASGFTNEVVYTKKECFMTNTVWTLSEHSLLMMIKAIRAKNKLRHLMRVIK